MAIGVVLDFEGATLDQYDEVVKLMGFVPKGPGAPGGIFHWATETEDGIRVTDVWENRKRFEQFAEDEIGPYTEKAGFPNPPVITITDVHNYLTAG